jgi:hypothetical protein
MIMREKRVHIGSRVRAIGPNKDDRGWQHTDKVGQVKGRNRRALYVVFPDGTAANFARDNIEAI